MQELAPGPPSLISLPLLYDFGGATKGTTSPLDDHNSLDDQGLDSGFCVTSCQPLCLSDEVIILVRI